MAFRNTTIMSLIWLWTVIRGRRELSETVRAHRRANDYPFMLCWLRRKEVVNISPEQDIGGNGNFNF